MTGLTKYIRVLKSLPSATELKSYTLKIQRFIMKTISKTSPISAQTNSSATLTQSSAKLTHSSVKLIDSQLCHNNSQQHCPVEN